MSLASVVSTFNAEDNVLLYFGSRWCPMARAFMPVLNDWSLKNPSTKIIYVSSDFTDDDFFAQANVYKFTHSVPNGCDDNTNLKVQFKCWAGMEDLELLPASGDTPRKYGLPTVVFVVPDATTATGLKEGMTLSIDDMDDTFKEDWAQLLAESKGTAVMFR